MMLASSTPYSSLPAMPGINALPGGIPAGPWGPLYRSAPGAQIPAVRYPGMQGARSPVTIQGARGAVKFQGALGQTESVSFTGLLLATLLSAGMAAAYAVARDSAHPVRNPAILMGGVTLGTGLVGMAMAKKAEAAAPAV